MQAREFRKKTTIEAVRFNGENVDDVIAFGDGKIAVADDGLTITTKEDPLPLPEGHWVAKGIEGEVWPIDAEIFEKTYEPV